MNVDWSRVRVVHPGGIVSPGRFIFQANGDGTGTAAVWTETRRPIRSATRTLYATGIFVRAPTARTPHKLIVDEGQEWLITQLAGGCGCNARNSALAGIPTDQLLSPDFTTV